MSADYGSATIAAQNSKGNLKAVQDMIGNTPALLVQSNWMQNGHIGASQDQVEPDDARAVLIAIQDTPAIGNVGDTLLWDVPTGTWGVAP